jgi:hypothetical protein
MSSAFQTPWEAREAAEGGSLHSPDIRAYGAPLVLASLPELVPAEPSLYAAVLARHPYLAGAKKEVLGALEQQTPTEKLLAQGHNVLAAHLLEAAVTALDAGNADVLEAMRTLDLDERDRLELTLERDAPAFAAALRAGTTTALIVERTAAALGCGPRSGSHKKTREQERGLAHTMPHERKEPKRRETYKKKLAEWRALDDPELQEMLDHWEATDPLTLQALASTDASLEGVKGFFRRNFGNKKTREKQIEKDYEKMMRKRGTPVTTTTLAATAAALDVLTPDEEDTVEADYMDDGVDDPYGAASTGHGDGGDGCSDYVREQQRLAAALDARVDGENLEVNIFKKIKEQFGKVKRRITGTAVPMALEPFMPSSKTALDQGGALLSVLSEPNFAGELNKHALRASTKATKATLVVRTLRGKNDDIKYVLNEKTIEVRTFLITREKGELTRFGGTKIVVIDLLRYEDRLRKVDFAPQTQFELSVRLDPSELSQMDSAKIAKGKITLDLRPTTEARPDIKLYYTDNGNPLVVFQILNGVLSFIYLVVVPADVPPRAIMASHVDAMAQWLTAAAETKESLARAHEELRAFSLHPATEFAAKRAQARANHILEEVLRLRLMAAIDYQPTTGVYPISTLLQTSTEKPTVAASDALRRGMDALSKAPADATSKQLAAALIDALAPALKDPVGLRSVTAVVSQALCAGQTRVVNIADAVARLANLWNPSYNTLHATFFAFNA